MSTPVQKIHAQKLVFASLLENKGAYKTALHHLIGPDELEGLLALQARNEVLEDALKYARKRAMMTQDVIDKMDRALETPAKAKGATP